MTAHKKDAGIAIPPDKIKVERCFYPNCNVGRAIEERDAHVEWRADIPLEAIYKRFPPVVKLAMQENCYDYERQYQKMVFDFYLHPECAAEWGMQLIKDALEADYRVGRRLSNREKEWEDYDQE